MAGVALELTLLRYGQTVEEIPGGSCTTDQSGACQIEVTDPPRMSDGYARGKLAVGEYGKQTIGWYGDQVEVTILVSNLALAATVVTPLEGPYEGQDQEPTDAPVTTAIHTATPKPSTTPTRTPPSTTATPTQTPPPPTATVLPSPTPTATPTQLTLSSGDQAFFITLLIGLGIFGLFAWRITHAYRKQQSKRQAQKTKAAETGQDPLKEE
jgi:hypothetical protein